MGLSLLSAQFPNADLKSIFTESEHQLLAGTSASLVSFLLLVLKAFSGNVSEIQSFLAKFGITIPDSVVSLLNTLSKLFGSTSAAPTVA